MEKTDGFGLGVDFVSGHGRFESFLGVVEAFVHDTDRTDRNETENPNCEHDFDEGVAS